MWALQFLSLLVAAGMAQSWTKTIHMEIWKGQTWSICWWSVLLRCLFWALCKQAEKKHLWLGSALTLPRFFPSRFFQNSGWDNLSEQTCGLVAWAMGEWNWFCGLDLHSDDMFSEPDRLMTFNQPHWLLSAQHRAGFCTWAPRSHSGRRGTRPDGLTYPIGTIRLQQALQHCGEKEKKSSTALCQQRSGHCYRYILRD